MTTTSNTSTDSTPTNTAEETYCIGCGVPLTDDELAADSGYCEYC